MEYLQHFEEASTLGETTQDICLVCQNLRFIETVDVIGEIEVTNCPNCNN